MRKKVKRRNQFFSWLLFLCMLFTQGNLSVFATELTDVIEATGETSGDYTYEKKTDTEIRITSYTGTDTIVEIPESMDGYTVVEIGEGAFANNSQITKVTLPDSIIHIEGEAFLGCTGLVEIVLSKNLQSIGWKGFYGCSSLKGIKIPKTFTSCGSNAFAGCESFTEVEFEEGLQYIPENMFKGCEGIISIELPDSVTDIRWNAFQNCTNLKNVKLGSGLRSIDEEAFDGCNSLEEIKLPRGVRIVYEEAFSNCSSLKKVVIPGKNTTLNENVFSGSSSVVIYAPAGSKAEVYATENNISFMEYYVPATSIKMSQSTLEMSKNITSELQVEVYPEDYTDEVVWTCSDEEILGVYSSGSNQVAILNSYGMGGVVTVTATIGDLSATCEVTVLSDIISISIIQGTINLYACQTEQLNVRTYPDDATTTRIAYSSSNENVARVDANGVVYAISEGTAIITATTMAGQNLSDSCTVNVKPALNGLVFHEDGTVALYKDSHIQTDFFGLVEHEGEWYHVKAGYVNFASNGLVYFNGYWFYVKSGKVDFGYTGVASNENGWWRVENGVVNFNFNGLASNENGWWYLENGQVNFEYSGFASNEAGTWVVQNGQVNFGINNVIWWVDNWYYIQGGQVQFIDTVAPTADGNWWRIKNGVVDFTFNGLAPNEGGWWYITNGLVDFTYTGIVPYESNWWCVQNGQINFNFQGLMPNEYGYWYLNDGKIDFGYEGLAGNEGGIWAVYGGLVNFGVNSLTECGDRWYYFEGGRLCEVTTMVQNEAGWWYVQDGRLDFTTDTVALYEGSWWYVEDGKINFSYDGMANNDAGWWYINDGRVDFTYSKKYTNSEGSWYFSNGKRTHNVPIDGYYYKFEMAYRNNDTSKLSASEKELFYGLKAYLDYAYQYNTLYEQEKAIHDYMALHVIYDPVLKETGEPSTMDVYYPRGVFVNGVAVCNGYALSFKLCMDILGIPCKMIPSNQMNHAWNAVQLEGEWYLVDVTWDDLDEYTSRGLEYRYFNVTDAQMGRTYSDIQFRDAYGTKFSYGRMYGNYIDNNDLYYYYVQKQLDNLQPGEQLKVVVAVDGQWKYAKEIFGNEAKLSGAKYVRHAGLEYVGKYPEILYAEITWEKE